MISMRDRQLENKGQRDTTLLASKWRKGATSQEMSETPKSWKREVRRFSSRAFGNERFPVEILILVLEDPCWISDAQN